MSNEYEMVNLPEPEVPFSQRETARARRALTEAQVMCSNATKRAERLSGRYLIVRGEVVK